MEAVIEKECSALGGLFQSVIGDMKNSYPIWEDFISKAGKLQSQLRATVVAAAAFLDAFQKVADLATNTRGGTRDIGSALTRMCMRHRSIEAKLRDFSMAFMDCMINPLQDQMEEWKRGTNTLDKDHAKEYKKVRSEIKKKSLDTLKLQKKAKKGRGDVQPQLNSAMQDVSDKYLLLEETEKQAVRKALVEERSRLCTFVSMLRPVVDEEISMLGEVTHLQTISDDLKMLTMDPHKLPPASEQVILDLKGSDYNWSYQTPPSSPSTTRSRKSSMCSSLNSVNSSDSRSSGTSQSHSPSSSSCSSHYGYRSSTLPQQAAARLSSMSSHDSGFISQPDTSKSPSPMPQETLPQPCSSSGSSEASETCQSVSECSSPTSGGPLAAVDKLSNGYDHYGDHHHSDSSYLMGGGSGLGGSYLMGGGSGLVGSYPLFPPSSHSSSITSSSCPSQSWSRPCSALLPDYPHYCTLGPNMVPTSKVPGWKDWAKPGPYDQPMVNTLRRRKDKDLVPADTSYAPLPLPAGVIPAPGGRSLPLPAGVIPAPGGRSLPLPAGVIPAPGGRSQPLPAGVIPAPGGRSQPLPPSPKVCEMEAHEELALSLSRGLQLDSQTQRSSRDSLHCSSGYSTQSTTPCCSEDTIPSQVSDYDYFSMGGDQEVDQQEFDKSSTIPRNSDISQSYRRMFQSKRPASTAGLPSTAGSVIMTPGVATIRRTPSTKPSARRGTTGPIPIRTPMIPVKIPTVPGLVAGGFPGGLGLPGGPGVGAEEPEEAQSPESPAQGEEGELGVHPLAFWSGQATTNPPLAPHQPGVQCQGEGGSLEDGEVMVGQGRNMLLVIQRGVKLKRTNTNDRSAPRIV
ncbi:protein MTSS 1-like isoform X3 [Salvelinus fontinalis]|uniref:protein MTSS 1-like isoform X3 n=1 Tax=Salvelinus fontinalis TaxID=8038 RepID=UPI0024869EEE|nr:protein MTSS 1-like isoform X3 [Salvelinus fontinalis]